MNYAQVLARLAGRVSRKVGQHTYLRYASGYVWLIFHGNIIMVWKPDGRIQLDTYGNRSATTRRRFNQWLPDGLALDRAWKVLDLRGFFLPSSHGQSVTEFKDGMTINTNNQ